MNIALVTGATSGIGAATAKMFAKKGYNLILTGRRMERLMEIKNHLEKKYDVKILALTFDVCSREQTEESFGSLSEEWQAIDVLVNNAGLAAGLEHIQDGDHDDWDRMIDTNIKGVLNVTRVIAPLMCARKRGHIINIGSIAGVSVYENGGVYCASKHAMHALSQSMRIDMLKDNIKVTEIRPGMVEFSLVRFHGDANRSDNVYKGVKPLSASDIAGVIDWAVSLPYHVNINDVEVCPQQQANAFYTDRR
ncbi:MAG: SDR family NAD(P)-dependent oxidoreductase [Rikenellaceae bacterium]